MSHVYDVAIIGAGPAGSSVAHHLNSRGIKNVLLIDKCVFPREKICGGALFLETQECLDEMGILEEVKTLAYAVKRNYNITPYGVILKGRVVESPNPKLLILRRETFDNLLLNHIKRLEVPVREEMCINGLWEQNGKISGIISREGEHVRAKVVVIATGANSSRFDLKRRQYFKAIGYVGRFENTRFEKNTCYTIYDRDFLPLYGWVIPEADNLANIGIGLELPMSRQNKIKKYFEKLNATYFKPYMKEARLVGFAKGFPLRYTYSIKDIVDRNVLYVGEAGGIVNAVTGEGISQALISGKFAAHAISNYLNNNEQRELTNYEKKVRRKFSIFPWLRLVKSFMGYKLNWRIIEMVQGKEGKFLP
ncbi:MAG: geranylgeranyl reductase family protein [Candidatus Scalindua sp. AMX11]|nr:MAG: geranylgeranyl reductase family protein [Candidatus Scalindua sp.]NOG82311.1 geranylgeranyl reductase family protein [Planctomycetota bacterium]RZV66651.1 MAG: geranylgeranyl reductase family protein [Candidatus Scalindua sp. SCAELEC01]TDE63628.1 MAG: geranylgeranyl reductase family protein [Candidatus Scalindua sp. AMX11]GJQ59994.1 MAG: geranylgeranyl hydrogenase BchP [Candidatus Scalindua sp.]